MIRVQPPAIFFHLPMHLPRSDKEGRLNRRWTPIVAWCVCPHLLPRSYKKVNSTGAWGTNCCEWSSRCSLHWGVQGVPWKAQSTLNSRSWKSIKISNVSDPSSFCAWRTWISRFCFQCVRVCAQKVRESPFVLAVLLWVFALWLAAVGFRHGSVCCKSGQYGKSKFWSFEILFVLLHQHMLTEVLQSSVHSFSRSDMKASEVTQVTLRSTCFCSQKNHFCISAQAFTNMRFCFAVKLEMQGFTQRRYIQIGHVPSLDRCFFGQ